jgi:hypothetical protein
LQATFFLFSFWSTTFFSLWVVQLHASTTDRTISRALWAACLAAAVVAPSGGFCQMEPAEALSLARAAAPSFEQAGLPRTAAQEISRVKTSSVARLWAGMGSVVELELSVPTPIAIIAKRVSWSVDALSLSDRRKRDSYVVEANFYGNGHAERLYRAGCKLPRALITQHRPDGITIVMSKVQGERAHLSHAESCAVSRFSKASIQ